jgi:hypothetical protein
MRSRTRYKRKVGIVSDGITRPDTFSGCEPGDIVYVESLPDSERRVYRQGATGQVQDISGATDAVEPIDGGYRIGGRKAKGMNYAPERWSAEIDEDVESSPGMIRGVVRYSAASKRS